MFYLNDRTLSFLLTIINYVRLKTYISWTNLLGRPIHVKCIDGWLRMGLLPPPREFCRHILSCRELKAESFKRCLHSVLRGVSLLEPVTYVT